MNTHYIILFFAAIILTGCSKSPSSQKVSISNEQPFYSLELSNQFDKHLPIATLSGQEFDHYLVLYRFKQFRRPEEAFTKIVYGTSIKNNLDLQLAETNLSTDENIVAYTFSNDWHIILNDGVEADRLLPTNFSEIPFSYIIDEDLIYEGAFPEPGFLADENTIPEIEKISMASGIQLQWSPSRIPDAKIKLVIIHHSSLGTELSPIQEFMIADVGSFNLSSQELLPYQAGDELLISLVRDVFVLQDDILIRGVEEQSWDFITLID